LATPARNGTRPLHGLGRPRRVIPRAPHHLGSRHVGTDQAASVELVGFERLIRDIRDIEKSLGDGIKRVYDSELGPRRKLRRVQTEALA